MGGVEVRVERCVQGAGSGQHTRVLAGTVVEDRQGLIHLVPRRRRGRFVIGPVRTTLQVRLRDPGTPQQVAHDLDVAGLAVVRGGHWRVPVAIPICAGLMSITCSGNKT